MMETGSVTTPFGRRPMTLGMLASQQIAHAVEPGTIRNKWKLFRAVCEARSALNVTERSLTVLDALLTFYPNDDLSQETGLIVFPSNAQLTLRARGMTAATLRRHLSVLVEAGLVVRKDSPNGKRYARRDREGDIDEAFGFNLSPLLARAGEIEALAAQVAADRDALRVTKERFTLCRRDIAKLITAALEEQIPGDWERMFIMFRGIVGRAPRAATYEILAPVLDELVLLREEVVNQLEMKIKTQKIDANESQNERHIQNSNPESICESEPRFDKKQGANPVDESHLSAKASYQPKLKDTRHPDRGQGDHARDEGHTLKSFPLGLVLQACPQIIDYGPGGTVNTWRDLMSAAIVVRTMLGVSPSAYEQACAGMGPENAATVIACILEKGGHINSAGGYLRDLTRRTEKGEFAIGPMLMALVRANAGTRRHMG